MKKLRIILLVGTMFLFFGNQSDAQKIDLNPWYFQIGIGQSDYKGDNGNGFFKPNDNLNSYGVARLGYYFHDKLDLNGEVSWGKHAFGVANTNFFFETQMTQYNLSLNFNFNRYGRFNPFLSLGGGYVNYKANDNGGSAQESAGNFTVPVGGGVKYQFTDKFGVFWKLTYGFNVGSKENGAVEQDADHWLHNDIGVTFGFGKKKDMDGDNISDKEDLCPEVPGLREFQGCPDTDGDGIQDSEDDCPMVAGPKDLNGCPDSDADGFLDKNDECPNTAGTLMGCPDSDGDGVADKDDSCPNTPGTLMGCPDTDGDGFADKDDNCPEVPGPDNGCPADSDGDGVIDEIDPCPNVAGIYDGCPDSDGDGIPDNLDKCPEKGGNIDNMGCPIIITGPPAAVVEALAAASAVMDFRTNTSKLSKSDKMALDNLADVLKMYAGTNVCIAGHTDSRGSEAKNMKLSQKRADAVRAYLVDKGVQGSTLASTGYGESMPIASNDTAEGRKMNRRDDMTACDAATFSMKYGMNPYIYPSSIGGSKGSGK